MPTVEFLYGWVSRNPNAFRLLSSEAYSRTFVVPEHGASDLATLTINDRFSAPASFEA
jgi:hypothetical protein